MGYLSFFKADVLGIALWSFTYQGIGMNQQVGRSLGLWKKAFLFVKESG